MNSLQGGQLDVIHTSDGQQVDALDQLAGQFTLMKEKVGRREVRYYLMNTAKPPLDDLNARKAVAMAIDRDAINELRNNGVFDVVDGPFDTKVPGYVKSTGYPKFNPKQAKKLVGEYKAAHGGEFSVVLEHTNDPANIAEAEHHQAAARRGRHRRHAEAGRPDRVHRGRGQRQLQHHAVAQPPRERPRPELPLVGARLDPQLRQDQRPRDAGADGPGAVVDRSRPSARASTRTSTGGSASRSTTCGRTTRSGRSPGSRASRGSRVRRCPTSGGKPLFMYGRHPLLGISVSQ